MSDQVVVAMVGAIPGVLWAVLAITVVIVFRKPIRDDIIPRITKVPIPGLGSLELSQPLVQRALEAARPKMTFPVGTAATIVERAVRAAPVLRGGRVLWLDDTPVNNLSARQLLAAMGLTVELAVTTEEALMILRGSARGFDVIITDMSRPGDPTAGTNGLAALVAATRAPIVVYVTSLDASLGTPVGAFCITNRPDELAHLVMDALERRRPAGRTAD